MPNRVHLIGGALGLIVFAQIAAADKTICRTPGVTIPNGGSVSDSLQLTGGVLVDLDVSIRATHMFAGTARYRLTHEETGTSFYVIDRPGLSGSSVGNVETQPEGGFPIIGCEREDIDVVLDDDATDFAENQCSATPPAIGGTLAPNFPLAYFNGESASGTWTLTASTVYVDDTLEEWCLTPTTRDVRFFEGHAYELFTATLNWADANAFAQKQSFLGTTGHLAVITTAAEDLFVIDEFDVYTDPNFFGPWIGMFCAAGADCSLLASYEWVTGEPVGYTGFAPGEPTGDCTVGIDGQCGVGYIDLPGWNDYEVQAGTQFVVEYPLPPTEADFDGDGSPDSSDNCTNVANPDQRDSDGDMIGNACDPDVSGDCSVDFADAFVYSNSFFMTGDLDTDNNGDGVTNFADLAVLRGQFFGTPGPSAAGCDAPRYSIGDTGPGGGVVFHVTNGGLHGLEAAPQDRSAGKMWACFYALTTAVETGIGGGAHNTFLITNNVCGTDSAAALAASYDGGGRDDWYLPSKDELNLIYVNLFETGLAQFGALLYWSSTESGSDYAWRQVFIAGLGTSSQSSDEKWLPYGVRPVRAF